MPYRKPAIDVDDDFPISLGKAVGGRCFRWQLFPPAGSACLRT